MATQGMENLQALQVRKIQKRVQEIQGLIWHPAVEVEDVALAETTDHISPAAARKLKYRRVRGPAHWGQAWGTAWFRLRGRVPAGFAGEAVSLLFNPHGECIVFRDGAPLQGLDVNRQDCLLFPQARGGERFELYVEAGANNAFGGFEKRLMEVPRLAVYNEEVWQAWHDLRALADLFQEEWRDWWGKTYALLSKDDTRRNRLIFGLHRAVDLFDYRVRSSEALRASARRLRRALKPLYACRAHDSAQTLACMGHAHIDVAWLWPLRETVRKCGRTFSNVLRLMEDYPEFIFCQSQPHLYEFTRERYPSLYRRIKAMVRKKKWIPTGCMWVEADCNVTSGESLVRQVLFGTRFFREEFNHEVCCLWLPDVFGYSAALPQILKRSGIDCFLTQKISWNQFTSFPYHSFHWQGIDGSRVLTHFPPINTYNAMLSAPEILAAERNYREKDRSTVQAVPFGFGDGGGGPTKEHLERMRRYRDLEGAPKLAPMTPQAFFDRLAVEGDDLPEWIGELYLELHRGTLTTQAWNKRFNRLSELLLRDVELLGALNLVADGVRYDQKAINEAWKLVLLNQFHDIIPGSSITPVYEDSDKQYAQVLAEGRSLREKAVKHYARRVDTRGEGTALLLLNTLSWERCGVVATDVPAAFKPGGSCVVVGPDGSEQPAQIGADGKVRFRGRVPSVGHAVYHLRQGRCEGAAVTASAKGMENDVLRVRFDKQGLVRSLVDKRSGREVIAAGRRANELLLFEDKPANWDAWDVDIFYNEKLLEAAGTLESIEVVEEGPVRAVVRVVRTISASRVSQDIVLAAGADRLGFQTRVDWAEERDVLLKVAFPVAVEADKARYEIQFGSLERPTHWNTPQDFARFEVTGHKWADLSEGDYGVALLNDCKYGYDIRGSVMRLSLLRAPKHPDPQADINKRHYFTYALLPHAGDFQAGVVRAGYELNVPVSAHAVASRRGPEGPRASSLAVTGTNVVIDTVKKAEDDDGIIVRLYEAHGCRGQRTLTVNLPVGKVVETDLMERPEKTLRLRKGKLQLSFTPFQIRTIKLVPPRRR